MYSLYEDLTRNECTESVLPREHDALAHIDHELAIEPTNNGLYVVVEADRWLGISVQGSDLGYPESAELFCGTLAECTRWRESRINDRKFKVRLTIVGFQSWDRNDRTVWSGVQVANQLCDAGQFESLGEALAELFDAPRGEIVMSPTRFVYERVK